ncbi:alpha/beta hydrolase [Herbihabitans rhizosphaerae]|nr:alpha/beta hydrolase [Herbihabitans rhizosphaerae]
MTRHKMSALLAAAGAVVAGLIVVPSAQAAPASPGWAPCRDLPAGLECTTVTVPLDYSRPNDETISVAVSRLPSSKPERRRGVLVLNPGGQGMTALDLPLQLVAQGLPASVRESYDLIAFDPRGIGRSAPVDCDLPPDFYVPPPYARDAADVTATAETARRTARQCAESPTGRMLPHITMVNVARDVDKIRQALGEHRISYLGYSYSTYLGGVYAELFGQHTDRFVLDSVYGPDGAHAWSRGIAKGFEDRFPDFAGWAAARHDTYGLGATPDAVRATYFEIAERLDAAPVNGTNGATFRGNTFAMLFGDAHFPALADMWRGLRSGVPSGQSTANSAPVWDFSGQLHLFCNDSRWPRDVATYQRDVERDRVRYPMFGAAASNIWPCAFWPAPQPEPVRFSDRGRHNLLLLSNVRDPGTPYADALRTRATLGKRATMVTVNAGGHLAYLYSKNTCADGIATRWLVDGELPRHDTVCR